MKPLSDRSRIQSVVVVTVRGCSFRVYPTAGQRIALAQAFGCARVVYNDNLRAREHAHAAGVKLSERSGRLASVKQEPTSGP